MSPEIKHAQEFVSRNSTKYFFFQAFNFGKFKKFNEEFEKQSQIYNEHRRFEGKKRLNILAFKFFKKDYIQEGSHYIFNINGEQHRFGILEILDYGIKQKAVLMADNPEMLSACEKDYLNSILKKEPISSIKRRL